MKASATCILGNTVKRTIDSWFSHTGSNGRHWEDPVSYELAVLLDDGYPKRGQRGKDDLRVGWGTVGERRSNHSDKPGEEGSRSLPW